MGVQSCMATTLFTAPPTDPAAESRKRRAKIVLAASLIGLLALAGVIWNLRFWPEQHVVDKLLTQVEKKDFSGAFATWNADPDWQQHAEKYSSYTYGQFQLDWGPTSEWGEVTSHEILKVMEPDTKTGVVSGVIVAFRVNGRAEPTCLWVEKKTKAISYSPRECKWRQLNIF